FDQLYPVECLDTMNVRLPPPASGHDRALPHLGASPLTAPLEHSRRLRQELCTDHDPSAAAVARSLAGGMILTGATSQSMSTASIAGAGRRRCLKVAAQRPWQATFGHRHRLCSE